MFTCGGLRRLLVRAGEIALAMFAIIASFYAKDVGAAIFEICVAAFVLGIFLIDVFGSWFKTLIWFSSVSDEQWNKIDGTATFGFQLVVCIFMLIAAFAVDLPLVLRVCLITISLFAIFIIVKLMQKLWKE
jgi:hypothetical protein